jgi:hypothetical protein
MQLLIISIRTIKGIRIGGVPRGTRWARTELGVLRAANII